MDTMSQTLRQPRRACRDTDDRFLGGVAAGVAAHLGLEPLHVRVAFLILALMGGFGVVVYAALWVLLPVADQMAVDSSSPGLAAATRRGMRTAGPRSRNSDIGVALSLVTIGLGVVVLLQNAGLWVSPRIFWPILVAATGLALLWWQTDETERAAWLSTGNGWKAWLRVLLGVALLASAVSLAVFQAGAPNALTPVMAAIALAVVGVGLVVGPWLLRLTRDLRHERGERIRSEERADVAAHLHDSVLQTLALIQRQAGDPTVVAQLARTQERELRLWLFDSANTAAATLKTGLQQAVAEVEDSHGVPIELVMVGDVALDDHVRALVAAAREAMVNSAKHARADRVDVFAEVSGTAAEVYVRDRGVGFDVAAIPLDRLGVHGSITDRMRRHGGSADIESSPGQGTEVRLVLPRKELDDER